MAESPKSIVQEAIDVAVGERGEIGVQVAAYLDSELVIDQSGGLADETTGREVDGDTLFPVFSNIKAMTATALHIQAERGLVDYYQPVARYWPEFGKHGKDKGTVFDALTHRIGVPLMPVGVTPELMCDWDWMVGQIAEMHPLFEPGTRSGYMAYTFGWVVGEVVRRTDPMHRPFGQFIQDEICQPLGITGLWAGIPPEVEPRVAKLTNLPALPPGAPGLPPDSLRFRASPPEVGTNQEVFGRSDVRQACIPGAQGIMNARSQARFYAMLANGGELDGVDAFFPRTGCGPFIYPVPPAIMTRCMADPTMALSEAFTSRAVPAWAPWAATLWLSAITGLAAVWAGRTLSIGWRLLSSTTAWFPTVLPKKAR